MADERSPLRGRWRRVAVWIAAGATVAATASLGLWQLDRARQKTELGARIEARGALPAWDTAALARSDARDLAEHHWRPVRLQGRWVSGASVFLDNRQMAGRPGFFLVTPLRLAGSDRVVLVQRGWVPRDFNDRSRVPAVPTPDGDVEVVGRLAPPPGQLYQLGEPVPGPIRQNIDFAAFRAETGLNLLEASVQQTGPSDEGLARAWAAPAVDVAKHHGYAFQWFALSTLTALLTLWFQIVVPRRKRLAAHGPDAR